jgi:hypothetical protein
MADLKISALTAASTPLAGTEVLPIVQSGTTKKVAVSDLTIGRAVSASSITATTSSVPAGSFIRDLDVGVVGDAGQTVQLGARNGATAVAGADIIGILESGAVTGRLGIRTLTGGSMTQKVTVASGGDATVNLGDLVIDTSGKGIKLPGGITWTSGAGSPEGVVTAPIGSLYSRSDGGPLTSLYVKQSGSGNTGWVGK